MISVCVYIWCRNYKKIPVGMWFSYGGSMEAPYALTEVWGTFAVKFNE